MDEKQRKLNELMKDEAFVKEFFSQKTPEEAQAFLEKNGVDASLDEIRSLGELLKKLQSGEISEEQLQKAANGELSEEELENVAGGSLLAGLGFVGLAAVMGGGLIYIESLMNSDDPSDTW